MLHINDLTYAIEGRILFDQATVVVPDRVNAGLVGRNGAGKSTLLRLIKGELSPQSGSISLRKGARLGAVDQEAPGGPDALLDVVLAQDVERAALTAEAETATDPGRIGEIQIRLADIEAHSAEARAAEILSGLGFSPDDLGRPCGEFSGGWRMRVALAGVLFARPDLLLLDEPTNYLDLEGALWLETHLKRFPGAALMVSHDRELLNGAVERTIHLRQNKLFAYEGGYDAFERRLAEQQAQSLKLKARQDAERRRLQAFVDRFRYKASKARQAQSRVKRLEKLEPVATIVDDPVSPFDIPSPIRRITPPLILLESISIGYETSRPVLSNLHLRLDTEDRIGLLGRNGSGKSTLAKLLAGRLEPLAGDLRKHKKLVVAYFAQHQIEALNPKESAYDHIRELMPDATEAQRRARLGRFGLPQEKGETPAGELSGGEKARLLLALVTFGGPHVLILDEPTNHLDMDARAALRDAVNTFEGAVVLISHDRDLIETCADRLWLAENGTVAPFDGDLDDYRKRLWGRGADNGGGGARDAKPDERAGKRRSAAARRADLAPLKASAQKWENEAYRLQGVIATIDKGLAAPGLFERDPTTAAELSKKRARAEELLASAELKWLEASEAYERARSSETA